MPLPRHEFLIPSLLSLYVHFLFLKDLPSIFVFKGLFIKLQGSLLVLGGSILMEIEPSFSVIVPLLLLLLFLLSLLKICLHELLLSAALPKDAKLIF